MTTSTFSNSNIQEQAIAHSGFGGNSDLQPDYRLKEEIQADNSKVFDTSRGIGSGNEPYLSTTLEEEEQNLRYLTSVDSDAVY